VSPIPISRLQSPGRKTGVYGIRNKITKKWYIGSAACSMITRWCQHRGMLREGTHHSPHLQASWNKYGEEAFEFVVLCLCPPEECLDREQEWMDKLRAADSRYGYNMYPDARSPLGTKRPPHVGKAVAEANRRRVVSLATRNKMSESQMARVRKPRKVKIHYGHWTNRPDAEEIKKKIGFKGPHSAATRAKMSAAAKGKKKTAEHRANISAALKGRKRRAN
jgi:group I intron endonuclease